MNNYPIKYTIMKIYNSEISSDVSFVKYGNYDPAVYIVTKAYVVEENVKYYGNGQSEQSYKVVFPYDGNNIKKENNRNIPVFDIHLNCINARSVAKVFDTYEEALTEAQTQNYSYLLKLQEIIKSVASSEEEYDILYNKEYSKYIDKIQRVTNEVEKNILKCSEDMIVKSNGLTLKRKNG